MQIFNLFIPCMAWITISMIYPLVAWNSKYFTRFECLFLSMAVCCFMHGVFFADNSQTTVLLATMVLGQYYIILLIPLSILFYNQFRNRMKASVKGLLAFILPSSFIFADLALLAMTMNDAGTMFVWNYLIDHNVPEMIVQKYQWLYVFHHAGFRIVVLTEIVYFAFRLIRDVFVRDGGIGTFLRGGEANPLNLIGVLLLMLLALHSMLIIPGSGFIVNNPVFYGIVSVLCLPVIVMTAYSVLFLHEERISWDEMIRSDRFLSSAAQPSVPANAVGNPSTAVITTSPEVLSRRKDARGGAVAASSDSVRPEETIATIQTIGKELVTMIDNFKQDEELSLRARFENLMIHQQAFLTPGITLTDVADALHTNKTYLSKMIHTTYTLAFPDYINTLRIDYAEQYILKHRDAKQDEIAKACGFPSASSFNTSFKKVTGMTPKIWLATKS